MNETAMRRAIEEKREGHTLDAATWEAIVAAYMDGTVDDDQMAAMLMACVWRGVDLCEATALTRAMVSSGATLQYPEGIFVVDKHSSGGVSDIVSLVAVPLVAACGVHVAKLSGRALGHTGGTIDKLETIPGFVVTPALDGFLAQVERVGCAIAAQSDAFVPADKRLYRLRDRTGTIPSTGLIAASIVSKKIAGGAHGFVFDVKCGNAAFMRDPAAATALGSTLVEIARGFGRRSRAVVTDMNEPLGRSIGTALEVIEARDFLRRGDGDARVREGCMRIATEMLELAGVDSPVNALERALTSGSAYERFTTMISAQHGDVRAFEALAPSPPSEPIVASRDGYVHAIDGVALGNLTREWNARDPYAGVRMSVRTGDVVSRGQVLAELYGEPTQRQRIDHAFTVDENAPEPRPLVYARI